MEITGYRKLNAEEVALINEAKELSQQCGQFIMKLRTMTGPQTISSDDCTLSLDQRWVSIGATDLQRGFMAVIRGIAQPTTF